MTIREVQPQFIPMLYSQLYCNLLNFLLKYAGPHVITRFNWIPIFEWHVKKLTIKIRMDCKKTCGMKRNRILTFDLLYILHMKPNFDTKNVS